MNNTINFVTAFALPLANGEPQDADTMLDIVFSFRRLLLRSDTYALPGFGYYSGTLRGALEDFVAEYEADPSDHTQAQAQAAHLRAIVKDIDCPTYVRPVVFVNAIVEDWHRLHQSQAALRLLTEIAKAEAARTEAQPPWGASSRGDSPLLAR